MARLYKCFNEKCWERGKPPGFEFLSDTPKCPKCGTSQDTPRLGQLIQLLTVIHFDELVNVEHGIGKGFIACDPTKPVGSNIHATGEAANVNCPLCKKTEAYLKADKESKLHPSFDVPINLDTQSGVIKPESLPKSVPAKG